MTPFRCTVSGDNTPPWSVNISALLPGQAVDQAIQRYEDAHGARPKGMVVQVEEVPFGGAS